MIAAIIPQFFSTDLKRTLTYFEQRLGFRIKFEFGDPATYAGMVRDGFSIYFRHIDTLPPAPPNKYVDELLDTYLLVDGVDRLYREYSGEGVEFQRTLTDRPWGNTEFVVKDIDGRLLCFGQETAQIKR